MTKILLAEDDDTLRKMTSLILEISGFDVFAYSNGQLALNAFSVIEPDLVVSDIGMPTLDGFGLLDGVRQIPAGAVVPFLFLSAHSEQADINAARRLGADDFLFKPFAPSDLVDAVRSRIERRRITELFDTRQSHLQTIILLSNVIEARDLYTRGHVERVQVLSMELGKALGWRESALSALEYGALLHDIGKISVSEAILNKPSRLTTEEQEIIQKHPITGARIIDGVSHLRDARPYILYHHEKWDGSGYPGGLKGNEIPVEGRLLAIVDVYDALTSDRPYHQGISVADSLKFLRDEAGKHFDPEMVEIFCKLQEIKQRR